MTLDDLHAALGELLAEHLDRLHHAEISAVLTVRRTIRHLTDTTGDDTP